jgi:hypothetical protein
MMRIMGQISRASPSFWSRSAMRFGRHSPVADGARERLGFDAVTLLDEGVSKTYGWMVDNGHPENAPNVSGIR